MAKAAALMAKAVSRIIFMVCLAMSIGEKKKGRGSTSVEWIAQE